jgi:hypothetical protein
MKTISTFTDVGWDFVNTWAICDGTNYPRLVWQIPAGDFLCPDGVDFYDFAFFANRWMSDCFGPDWCDGCDLDESGKVDYHDLAEFTQYWLEGI